jgi:hypothetical protein
MDCGGGGRMKNPITIPISQHVVDAGYKFIRVSGKKPIDRGWPDKGMDRDDPRLLRWFYSGNNYGVLCTGNNIIIDMDTKELVDFCIDNLPHTYMTQSGSLIGGHAYFIVDNPINTLTLYQGDKSIGHVKAHRSMCVGTGSIHEKTGNVYKTVHNTPVARISTNDLVDVIKPYLPEKPADIKPRKKLTVRKDDKWFRNITLADVGGYPINPHSIGREVYGEHPVHGSTTGRNFWVNIFDDTWYCHRCESGGGPLEFFAVKEGMIECAECGHKSPLAVDTNLFHNVLLRLKLRGFKR